MGLGLKVHVGHVLGLEHDLGLGVDPTYKPYWDHIMDFISKCNQGECDLPHGSRSVTPLHHTTII